jgi:hypothetical protein
MAALVYLACRAAGARWQAAVVTTAPAVMATLGSWAERPQLFTLVFLALLVWTLRAERLRPMLVWIGPVVIALWANLHILFVGGVGLLAVAAVCAVVEGRDARPLALATLLSAAAMLANPYGWELVAHLPTIAAQRSTIPAILEFQSPDFGSELGTLAGAFLLFAIAALWWSRERPSAFELITFLGSLALGLTMIRNMALFAILAAPTVARHFESSLPLRAAPAFPAAPAWRALQAIVALGAVALLLSILPHDAGWRDKIERAAFPVAAADFVAVHDPEAKIFNHFNWGGFLIYRLYPRARVSIDGRGAAYAPETFAAYLKTESLAEGWETFLEDTHPDLIVWPADHPLSAVLRRTSRWRVVFEDPVAVVFARAGGAPRALP